MKSFLEFLAESQRSANAPVTGDIIEFEVNKQIFEARVIDHTSDSCILELEEDEEHYPIEVSDDEEKEQDSVTEAKYHGREVPLNKPMQGDVKKFKVYVKDPKTGNIKKVNFGDKTMRIKKSNPKRRKSFRARHNCANPGPKTKARYWSCRKW